MAEVIELSGKKEPLFVGIPVQAVEVYLVCPTCNIPCPPTRGSIVTQGVQRYAHHCPQCGEVYYVEDKFPQITHVPIQQPPKVQAEEIAEAVEVESLVEGEAVRGKLVDGGEETT